MELKFIVVLWIYRPCSSLNTGPGEQGGGSMDYFLESSSATVREGRQNDATKYIAKENYQLLTDTSPTRDEKGLNLNEEMQPSHYVEFISELIPSSVISRYILQSLSNDTHVTHISRTVIQDDPTITSALHLKKSRPPHLISKQQTITRDLGSLVTDMINYSNAKYQARPNYVSINSEKTPHLHHSFLPELYISEGKYTDQKVINAAPKVSVVKVLYSMQSEVDEISENPLYLNSFLLGLYHSSKLSNFLSVVLPTEEETPPLGMESYLYPQGKVKILGISEYGNPSHISLTSNFLSNVNIVFTSILSSSISQGIFGSVPNSETVSRLLGVNDMTDKEILKRQLSKGEFLSILPADTLGKVKTLIISPHLSVVSTSTTKLVRESSKGPSSYSTGLFQSTSTKSYKESSEVLLKGFYTKDDYLSMFSSLVSKILDSFEKPKVGGGKEITDKPEPYYSNSDKFRIQNHAISPAHSSIKQHFDYFVTHTLPIEKIEEISTLSINLLNKSSLTGLEFDQKSHNSNKSPLHPGEIQTTGELPNGVLEFVSSVLGIPLHMQETHKVATSASPSISSSATSRTPQMDFGKLSTSVSINESLGDYLDEVHKSNKKMEENLKRNTMVLLIIGGIVFQIQLIVGLVIIWWWLRAKVQRILNNDSLALCDGLSKVVNFRNSAKLTEESAGQSARAKNY